MTRSAQFAQKTSKHIVNFRIKDMDSKLRILIREYIQLLIEGPVPLRKPMSVEQQKAFLELLQWAGEMMGAGPSDISKAVAEAKSGDWTEALDLLRTYYLLKGIKYKKETN